MVNSMWQDEVTSFWGDTIKFCIFLGNPFCSDDAFGYHAYIELKNVQSTHNSQLRIFYSYNIEVEPLITALMEESPPKTILIIDTIHENSSTIPIRFLRMEEKSVSKSSHKAEFSIIKQISSTYGIDVAMLLVSITEIQFTGEIIPLTPPIESLKQELVNFFSDADGYQNKTTFVVPNCGQ